MIHRLLGLIRKAADADDSRTINKKTPALWGEESRGATVKGAALSAVYAKGRVSWDNKALEGYAVAHPELLAFRSEGAPSVSIRGVK
ncbi:MAG: hypothetical protein HONDAALG_03775 [Gammaproteobacteria bacterium]|nr:hypothetical protein [Gammaproteobacteria bacterium]